jgi:hypothetical protein
MRLAAIEGLTFEEYHYSVGKFGFCSKIGAKFCSRFAKYTTRKLVAKTPFTVILKTYLAKLEAYIVRNPRYELIKKGRGNGGEQRQ